MDFEERKRPNYSKTHTGMIKDSSPELEKAFAPMLLTELSICRKVFVMIKNQFRVSEQ